MGEEAPQCANEGEACVVQSGLGATAQVGELLGALLELGAQRPAAGTSGGVDRSAEARAHPVVDVFEVVALEVPEVAAEVLRADVALEELAPPHRPGDLASPRLGEHPVQEHPFGCGTAGLPDVERGAGGE